MRYLLAMSLVLLAACGGGKVAPAWESNTHSALNAFQGYYLRGDSRAAAQEFNRAVEEIRSTGRGDLLARAELLRCAVRAASLEFDDCPGYEKLKSDAGPEEVAYADFLSGKTQRAPGEEPLSRLVNLGVQFRAGKATPESINAAVDVSSAQGWRRPLLAWLGVQEKRAEAAGDRDALERIRRRIALVSGKS
jgi:hypothetical protein